LKLLAILVAVTYTVGIVVFVILTIINVVTKGAAGFGALDAMPKVNGD
jgi:flagellar biosynthesis component FlhA